MAAVASQRSTENELKAYIESRMRAQYHPSRVFVMSELPMLPNVTFVS